jgi:hypothetical protein
LANGEKASKSGQYNPPADLVDFWFYASRDFGHAFEFGYSFKVDRTIINPGDGTKNINYQYHNQREKQE